MAQTKSPDSEDLQKQIATLRQDLAGITETLGAMAKAQKEGMTDAAQKRFEDARARGADAINSAQAQANALNAQAHDFVQEKPALSLGMAAALGFVVGILSTNRR
ncbi:DUF883 family protein [Roseovarius nanhaiticus]|uniref:Membrane-anchored ribosome-binding protein, inhibits growth in stationary phase, ElaB/YqjD/DUF883 family n=1 Tax=Roseovarius nanhaiticus TaxID=573024 RepID=A0A1N7H0L4_9RHOB|nr:DUF883 family protein [Roseovarius nanhaiticus]SEL17282.1 Membrane-anchored ribosome-binding protein, inhibits growth in stationary phase, ElaB/YqjD/DUF883 family [Roseovarius nanhaiticus]SIS18365.1 Membrane-anchored ribosome-binding protein, inhibits growth in stationary phase, ElaB/YqjD/DUF883 family [Roseovarius nanhaiticus]